jgi:hypothetical protein
MTDLNTARVIPFCRKFDEWPSWSVKLLAKDKRYEFKDLFSVKLSIPKSDEEFDEISDIGKKLSRTIELNDIAHISLFFPLM